MMRIAIDGGGEFEMAREVVADTMVVGAQGLKAGLLFLEGKLKRKLSGRRTGRWYRVPLTKGRGARSRWHRASAPGEPPAVLFGHLRNSVTHRGPNVSGYLISGELGVGFGLVYAKILEFGGFVRGRRLAARPYLRPTMDENVAQFDRIVQTWLDPYFVGAVRGSTL